MSKRPVSTAQKLQREHYHRLGSVMFCVRLLEWLTRNHDGIPPKASRQIGKAINALYDAFFEESCNNEFISRNRK